MSSTSNIPIAKYRPSVTGEQITHIIRLAKLDMSTESIELIKTLAPFEAKILAGAMLPAHLSTPRQSLEDSLGMTIVDSLGKKIAIPTKGSVNLIEVKGDKVAYNLSCYNKYKLACTVDRLEDITPDIMEAAKEHMYVNDLMTPEEEAEYERNES